MRKIILILIIFSTSNLIAQRNYFYVNATSVRLRESPSLDSKIIKILKENESVDFEGEKSDERLSINVDNKEISEFFYKVKTSDDKIGWVFKHYLSDPKDFESGTEHCNRSMPSETVLGINKKVSKFNRKNLEYLELFTIDDVNYTIKNGGCDFFSQVFILDSSFNNKLNKSTDLLNLIKIQMSKLLPYYQHDFDLAVFQNHLNSKKIKFNKLYQFRSGKLIKTDEDENPGPSFEIKAPVLKNNRIKIEIIFATGVL